MREDKQETGASVRTWPGIVMLVCIAVVLCAGIYLFAYKSGYLPMPAYLERFFSLRSGTDGTAANGDATGAFFRALPDGTPETSRLRRRNRTRNRCLQPLSLHRSTSSGSRSRSRRTNRRSRTHVPSR